MLCCGERITADKLREKVERLNRVLNRPVKGWTKTDDGLQANIGHLYIDGANGGYRLEEHVNEDGGAMLASDRMSAREMYHFLVGMEMFHALRCAAIATKG